MSFEWFVARRYLTARRRQALISLISAVSIVGVAVGVMALVIALALMTGVQSEMRDRIVGSQAHIYVHRLGGVPFGPIDEELARMASVRGVAGGAPAIAGRGLMVVAGRDSTPVEIKGIDPALEPRVTEIATAMIAGSLEDLGREPGVSRGVIVGEGLATSQGLKVGDDVTIVSPKVSLGFGMARPTFRVLTVVGIARFGFYQVDAGQAFVSLQTAAEVLGAEGPTMIQLRLTDLDDARRVRDELQTTLGHTYNVMDWIELNAPLYSALWLEKVAISTTIGLIVMVAALNIVASLVLLVMEKSRDIAILRTMGAPARAIRRIFVLQGLTIGLVGTLTGAALGLFISFIADRWHLLRLDGQVYQITHVPFRVQPFDVIVVVLSAIGVCLLATVYPSRQAARLDPAEALRNQ
jgi:lipoprotein-releasing system permease protein